MLLVAALPALGAGGSLEINHACATIAGCFPGDAPGYPVTITLPGAYHLTSNLVIPDADTDGIEIEANDVGIDLRGLAILGANCVSSGGVCSNSGFGNGVADDFLSPDRNWGTSLRNGTIAGMGARAAELGDQANLSDLTLRSNRFSVTVGDGSRVRRCVIEGSRMGVDSGSVVTDNVVSASSGAGLDLAGGSVASRNTTFGNDFHGITGGSGLVLTSNTSRDNVRNGIFVRHSVIAANAVYANGTGGDPLTNAGIDAVGSLVIGNTMTGNNGYGLEGIFVGYRENVINGNGAGTVTALGGPVNMGANSCNGTATCP